MFLACIPGSGSAHAELTFTARSLQVSCLFPSDKTGSLCVLLPLHTSMTELNDKSMFYRLILATGSFPFLTERLIEAGHGGFSGHTFLCYGAVGKCTQHQGAVMVSVCEHRAGSTGSLEAWGKGLMLCSWWDEVRYMIFLYWPE